MVNGIDQRRNCQQQNMANLQCCHMSMSKLYKVEWLVYTFLCEGYRMIEQSVDVLHTQQYEEFVSWEVNIF